MPLYEYTCDNGHRFELIRKFSDPPLEKCPTCGAAVQKLISSPAIQFKGTGWYITDYAKKDQAPAGKSMDSGGETSEKSEGKSDSSEKSESKSDAKSDAKTESKTESKTETKSEAPALKTTKTPKTTKTTT